jgi:hypothetical protein
MMHDNRTNDASMRDLLGDDAYEALYSPKTQMALALGRVKHTSQVYGGTASPFKVAKRRAKNRVARASRRANRQHARALRAHR